MGSKVGIRGSISMATVNPLMSTHPCSASTRWYQSTTVSLHNNTSTHKLGLGLGLLLLLLLGLGMGLVLVLEVRPVKDLIDSLVIC